ncbi:hypothetical protein CPC08DRAFT_702814 [Agrocybe pediades]|nr:hypothetical protein CPC08DRAFT_702814 [Agrocybe pediades]
MGGHGRGNAMYCILSVTQSCVPTYSPDRPIKVDRTIPVSPLTITIVPDLFEVPNLMSCYDPYFMRRPNLRLWKIPHGSSSLPAGRSYATGSACLAVG